jgi:hypothetical protein
VEEDPTHQETVSVAEIIETVIDELAVGVGESAGQVTITRTGPGSLALDYGDSGRFTLRVAEVSDQEPYPTPRGVIGFATEIRRKMLATATRDAETNALLNALSAIKDLAEYVDKLSEQVETLGRHASK